MSTDRELLELAAKAAGMKFHAYVDHEIFGTGINTGEPDVPFWNPLTDDGDALRLAVRLGLYLEIDRPNARASALPEDDNMPFQRENFAGDPCAALRRAIVRAAAEIARGK